ncbi:glutathione-S-transferase [Oleiphilus messinensis]|uniref:Glutathione-S-transferase n=1 Tax=Oleiphilus messinensis TaxID=141451 RepID=A0A1Y0I9J2_9GAMM|nr:glutathione binding-like protein [Oleiphilus messinensis]ARU56819.1 glutathione-S-transferase [Oleiphilus messinensis]
MLRLLTWSTQNARKISIMLEECESDYTIAPINIEKQEQFNAEFKALNPNSKIPVLLDTDLIDEHGNPEPIFETGAILLYLAEKSGQFLPEEPAQRARVIKWLFWQTSGLGPVFGNFSHFASALAKDASYLNNYLVQTRAKEANFQAIERFSKESFRLLGVLNNILSDSDYIAGDLSIADFASYPWIESAWAGLKALNNNLETDFQHVANWMQKLQARPGVQKGMSKLAWGKDLS